MLLPIPRYAATTSFEPNQNGKCYKSLLSGNCMFPHLFVSLLFVVLTQGTESLTASGTTFLVDLHSTRLARSAGCSHEFHNNCIGEWARTFAVTRCGFNSMSRVTNHLVRCAKLSSETSNLVHLRSRYNEEAVFDARTFLLSGILGTTNRN